MLTARKERASSTETSANYVYQCAEEEWRRQQRRPSVANNVGCILRDKGKPTEALRWFRRAVKLGDGDANLNIAKLYLRLQDKETLAVHFLKKTCRSRNATVGSKEEARHLLKHLEKAGRRPPAG